MELRLTQRRLDPIERYTITSNGEPLFRSERSLGRSVLQETLLRDTRGELLLKIRPRVHWWRPRYDLIFASGAKSELITASWVRGIYEFAVYAQQFTVFSHRSLTPKYSLFSNGLQVAAILRRPYSVLDDDVFRAVLSPETDPVLVSAVALTLDRISPGSRGPSLLSLHLLPTFIEARSFDENWLRIHAAKGAV